jgi:hypothetical protein
VYTEVLSKSHSIMILSIQQTWECQFKNFEDYTTRTFSKNKKLATGLQSGAYCLRELCASLRVTFQQHVCHVKTIQQFLTGYIQTGRKTDRLYRDIHIPKKELLIWTLRLSISPPRIGKGKITGIMYQLYWSIYSKFHWTRQCYNCKTLLKLQCWLSDLSDW